MNRFAALWPLDPQLVFLNHGSFGSCPLPVLEQQQLLRHRLERQPVQFLVRELEPMLDAVRQKLATFVAAAADDLVLVPNATYGVNSVLRSLEFQPGDELLVTDHEYNACRNALDFVAGRSGARVVSARIPFPLQSPQQVVDAVLASVTPRTRLLLVDHISSQTALVFPLAQLVAALNERGVDTLVDGAHAPGQIALDIDALGAAYYTGNCHKWMCAPKGAAFLHVHADRQHLVRPLAISHGANSTRSDRSRFQIEFGWTGTLDPSAMLCIPHAIDCLGSMLPGGWPAAMAANRDTLLQGRALLCAALGIEAPCPESMLGAMGALPVADASDSAPARSALYQDPLQDRLLANWGIEVPIIPWPAAPRRLLRISAQLYNEPEHYRRLAEALVAEGLSGCNPSP